jgi:hypothetical protein
VIALINVNKQPPMWLVQQDGVYNKLKQTLEEISILSACTLMPPQQPEVDAYTMNLDGSIS